MSKPKPTSKARARTRRTTGPAPLALEDVARVDGLAALWRWIISARARFQANVAFYVAELSRDTTHESLETAERLGVATDVDWLRLYNQEQALTAIAEADYFDRELLGYTKRALPPFALRAKYADTFDEEQWSDSGALSFGVTRPIPMRIGPARDESLAAAYGYVARWLACHTDAVNLLTAAGALRLAQASCSTTPTPAWEAGMSSIIAELERRRESLDRPTARSDMARWMVAGLTGAGETTIRRAVAQVKPWERSRAARAAERIAARVAERIAQRAIKESGEISG